MLGRSTGRAFVSFLRWNFAPSASADGALFSMITIKAKVDLKAARAALEGFSDRRFKTTVAIALTKTAQLAQKDVIASMKEVFNQPTRWTLNSTRLIPATKDRLFSQVWLKDRQNKVVSKPTSFLYPQVFAGRRDRKAYETALLKAGILRSNEFTVPAEGFPLDAFGNVPVGVIRQILSQLKAAELTAGYTANKTNSARSRRAVAKAGAFFVPRVGSTLPRGIYQRMGKTTRMVMKIVVGKPGYKRRLNLFTIGQRAMDKYFERQFDVAFNRSLARLRAR
jgi:hypothetical protein